MKEHNKTYYSLEELKRARDCYEGYQDGEEVYYFVGALRYACDEIERLKEMKLHTEKYASEMEDKYILEKNKNDKAIEYSKELMLFKKNSRQYLIGKCMLEKLGGVDKE